MWTPLDSDESWPEPPEADTEPDEDVVVWTTNDGQMIPIEELSDNHLTNICKMLTKKANAVFDALKSFIGHKGNSSLRQLKAMLRDLGGTPKGFASEAYPKIFAEANRRVLKI